MCVCVCVRACVRAEAAAEEELAERRQRRGERDGPEEGHNCERDGPEERRARALSLTHNSDHAACFGTETGKKSVDREAGGEGGRGGRGAGTEGLLPSLPCGQGRSHRRTEGEKQFFVSNLSSV